MNQEQLLAAVQECLFIADRKKEPAEDRLAEIRRKLMLLRGHLRKSVEKATIVAALVGPAEEIFDHWKSVMEHPHAQFTRERKKAVLNRLNEGYTVEQIKLAIKGCKKSPFNQGQNDKNQMYDDLELICRDGKHVEQFITIESRPDVRRLKPSTREVVSVVDEWVQENGATTRH